jgi:hypothetical protein
VEKFGKRPRLSNNGITCPFQTVRKREEVDIQWAKSVVSAGLPMSLFDIPEVRKTVLMTVECGQNYIRTKPGGVKEPTLTHLTFFTTKRIPKLDHLIDDKYMGKMREMTRDLTVVVFRDGWTDVNHHPIVNIIMGVRSLHTLRASIDTMGQDKTMDFITALILEHIKEIGEDRVLLTCFVSVFEHILSIEGCIHSNRRNRLGQKLVELLVLTHTYLKLEQRLEMY